MNKRNLMIAAGAAAGAWIASKYQLGKVQGESVPVQFAAGVGSAAAVGAAAGAILGAMVAK